MFQNLPRRLSAVFGISHEVIKFRRLNNICGDFSYVLLRMPRNVYLGVSGKNPDISILFLDPDFLMGSEILAISRRFPLIFSSEKLKVRHMSTSGLFYLLT